MLDKLIGKGLTRRDFLKKTRGLAAVVVASQIGFPRITRASELLSEFDWRNYKGYNWMTPVKSQGNCTACELFASVGAIEAKIKIDLNNPNINPDLSEQYIISCTDLVGCSDVVGAQVGAILNYIRDYGIVDESCFPYTSQTGNEGQCTPCSDSQNKLAKIKSWAPISDVSWFEYDIAKNRETTKRALIEKGPLIVQLYMGNSESGTFMENFGDDGIYRNAIIRNEHTIVLCGYNDTGDVHKSFWTCKNSWGDKWGFDGGGYFKIGWDREGYKDQCYVLGRLPIYVETKDFLECAIKGLQVLTGVNTDAKVSEMDFNRNKRIDLGDIIYSLQKSAGLR